jgi:glutaredoxin-like protein
MAPLIGEDDRKEIDKLLSACLLDEVRVLLFTSKRGCEYCGETLQLLEEVRSLGKGMIRLEVIDIEENPGRAEALGVELAPTTVILASDSGEKAIHYSGMPGGRQLGPLVEGLVDASRGRGDLDVETLKVIMGVRSPTVIKVFVTPACLYSPSVVRSAHKFALANPLIRSFMVEALEFPHAANKYGVVGVPTTVVNERFAFEGAPGEKAFAEKVLEMSLRS